MRKSHFRQKGVTLLEIIITIIIVTVVLVVISVVMGWLLGDRTPPAQEPRTEATCFTYCSGLVEFQCGDNDIMGFCLGFWDCTEERGAHICQ